MFPRCPLLRGFSKEKRKQGKNGKRGERERRKGADSKFLVGGRLLLVSLRIRELVNLDSILVNLVHDLEQWVWSSETGEGGESGEDSPFS